MTNEILTPEQMFRADELAVQKGVPSFNLMENAGRAVTLEILRRFKKCAVAVLCGPGNNGGDGFVVARRLKTRGWPVKVYLFGDRETLKGNAAAMAAKWKGAIGKPEHFANSRAQLIVDAIFGAGLNRDFPHELAELVHYKNAPVVAIDVPSGLDGRTGLPRGAALKADLTVTFFRRKPGHLLQPGRFFCGDTVVADIGIPESVIGELSVALHENVKPALPEPRYLEHKYRRGHAVIWSGPEFNTGAARLAAMACARSGAGLTTIVGTEAALRIHAQHLSSIMLRPLAELDSLLSDKRVSAWCIGPAAGTSSEIRGAVRRALQTNATVVLDADALTVFADDPGTLSSSIKSNPDRAVVMTPHEGEFRRFFRSLASADDSKVERARVAAKECGAIVVFKGPDTVIAHPDGRAAINGNAPPRLATAGSGDVLAGIVTGLVAQGMEAFAAASAAAWLHGEAANRAKRRTIIAEDLIDQLGLD